METSDPEIATIDENGIITPVGYGVVTFDLQNKTTGAKKSVTTTITKTLTATYEQAAGMEELEECTGTCLLKEKKQTECKLTLPTVKTTPGYSFVGWSQTANATTGVTDVSIEEDVKLYPVIRKDEIEYTATFTKPATGVETIGKTELKCKIDAVYGDTVQATSCKVTLPTITASEGYTVIGWSDVSDATTGLAAGTEIDLTSNKTYYAIIKKNAVTLKATFKKNGAAKLDESTEEEVVKTCVLEEVYNQTEQSTSCKIVVPKITASEATPIVIGFNDDKDAIVKTVDPETEMVLTTETTNKTYYALTKSELKEKSVTFYRNGAKTLDGETSDSITKKCNIGVTYNGVAQAEGCSITSPVIEASEATPKIIGYSTSADSHTSVWESGKEKTVTKETDEYYAQTNNEEKTKTATFKIASTTKVSKIANATSNVTNTTDSLTETCKIGITYNGVAQAESCTVTSPSITAATGYKNPFWGESTSATSGEVSGATLTITKNETYYANASISSYSVTYDAATNGGSTTATSKTVNYNTAIDLTPTATKTGYTFKGWNTNKEATTGLTSLTMGTSNVTLYAIFVDETAPKCSWSTSSAIGLNTNATLTLTCEDAGSGITAPPTLAASDFTVTAKGSIASVTGPTAVTATKKYTYTVAIKGISAGTFTVTLPANKVSDGAGNKNEAVTSSAVTVNKGTVAPTVNMSGYTYGGTKSTPSVSGNTENGAVTYYYNTTNSNSGGTAWTNVTSATSLNAGTYYMYATIGATDNYNAATTQPVAFTIAQANGKVTLGSTSGSITYGTASTTFTVTGNTGGGQLTVSDDNSTATSSVSGTTVTIGSLGSINAGTSVKVTVTSSATTNYKAATATYTLTINKANISPKVTMSGYTFAGTKSTPSISGNTGNGTVTYYYTTSNTNSGGTAWTSVTSSSSLAVGTYYMYATVGATTNYNSATTSAVAFTISGIKRTATFNANGNTISTPSGCSASGSGTSAVVTCSCTTTGTSTSCTIAKAPTITAPTNTPTVIGFSTGATTRTNSVSSAASNVSLSSNPSYYAQTTKEAITYSVTYSRDTNSVASISSTSSSCTIASTYNGVEQAASCSVTVPTITAAEGYTTDPCPSGYTCSTTPGWYLDNTGSSPSILSTVTTYTFNRATYDSSTSFSYTARARVITASEVSFNNAITGYNCTNFQCAIDELNKEFK